MFIPQPVHEKAAGRQRRTGLFAVAGRKHISNVVRPQLAAADIDKGFFLLLIE